MRDIKFRAWDGSSMIQDFFKLVHKPANRAYDIDWPETYSPVLIPTNPQAVMQFTGLKDCNGVEIYEGDILEFDADEWYRTAHRHKFTGIPEHGPREAVTMEMLIDGNYFGSLSDFTNYKRVIGNIFQNKELLE